MRRAHRLTITGRALALLIAGVAMGALVAAGRGTDTPPVPPPPPRLESTPIAEGRHLELLPLVTPASGITTSSEFVFRTPSGTVVSGRLAENAGLLVDGQSVSLTSFEDAMTAEAPATAHVTVDRRGVISELGIRMRPGPVVRRAESD